MYIILILLSISIILIKCDYPFTYCINFDTNINNESKTIIINVTQSWSPNGANHLFDIINSKFYSVPSAFFRIVPEFVVQFGISGDPIQNTIWNKPILDDPVRKSNTIGTVSYATAGPNTHPLGFSPFGIVTTGLDIANRIFNPTPGNPNGVDQEQYSTKGNGWILKNYPKINFIEKASITFFCPIINNLY